MNHIAFIFSTAPHGSSSGREGLDALLAVSTLSKDVGVFFISDGVFQLIKHQNPSKVLARNYIATFNLLILYNVKDIWICMTSMQERGLRVDSELVINAKPIPEHLLSRLLSYYQVILKF